MKKYAVHKKAFFYTDEGLGTPETGSIVGIYDSIEGARFVKKQADIKSMLKCGGYHVDDFIFYNKNQEEIKEELKEYYEEELKQKINPDNGFSLPNKLNEEMAMDFLEILEFSFHVIIEYSDDKDIPLASENLKDTNFSEF